MSAADDLSHDRARSRFRGRSDKPPQKSVWEGVICFDPTDAIYEVHFPSRPVVPGSLIVHAFLKAAGEASPAEVVHIEDFRFREFITPGSYAGRIERQGTRLHCKLRAEGRLLATGYLVTGDEDENAAGMKESLRADNEGNFR
jgi:3-hydroxyacyl-[acyl-carrier-protein] dehydratase